MGPSNPFYTVILLKFRIYTRNLFGNSDFNWSISQIPLRSRFNNSIWFYSTNHTRHLVWMILSINTHKRSLNILFIHLLASISRNILFQSNTKKSMTNRKFNFIANHGYFIPRLRATMGTDILLGCSRNYKLVFHCTNSGRSTGTMNLRRLFSKLSNLKSILFPSFFTSISSFRYSNGAFILPSPSRIYQPHGFKKRHRQGTIPSLLYFKRHIIYCIFHLNNKLLNL